MTKLLITIANEKDKQFIEQKFQETNWIKKIDQGWYMGDFSYSNHLKNKQLIKLEYQKCNFDESLVKELIFVIKNLISMIQDLFPNHEIKEREQDILEAIVASITMKFSHLKEPSFFQFITQIFLKILMKHFLIDGNKRTAIVVLVFLLNASGIHFIWAQNIWYLKNRVYEKTCLEIIENLQNKDYSNIDLPEVKKVENWIKNKIRFHPQNLIES